MFIHLNATLADSNQGKLNSCHLKGQKKIGLTDLQKKGEISLTGNQTHSNKCQGKQNTETLGGGEKVQAKAKERQEREDFHGPKKKHGLERIGNLCRKNNL